MAKVTLNEGAKPFTGRVGNLVFRKYRGQLIVSGYVAPSTPPTARQRARRSLFRDAVSYAKSVVGTAVWKEVYAPYARKTGCSVFSAAVADFMNPPVIDVIDLRQYHGSAGDSIMISCHDDFGVSAVHVAIHAKDGPLIEEGIAIAEGAVWRYTTKTAQASGQRVAIASTATDRAGRTAQQVSELEIRR